MKCLLITGLMLATALPAQATEWYTQDGFSRFSQQQPRPYRGSGQFGTTNSRSDQAQRDRRHHTNASGSNTSGGVCGIYCQAATQSGGQNGAAQNGGPDGFDDRNSAFPRQGGQFFMGGPQVFASPTRMPAQEGFGGSRVPNDPQSWHQNGNFRGGHGVIQTNR